MNLRQLLHILGFPAKPRKYGTAVEEFHLPVDGTVRLAQWKHPKEGGKSVDQAEVDELRRYLAPGDTAIDIGAYTGDTAVPMAVAVGSTGCVLALEPNEYIFPVLEENARLNPGKTNIVALPFAATPEDGEFEFGYCDSGFGNGGMHEGISVWRHGHAFKLKVVGRNLETLVNTEYAGLVPRLRYIKVDAEGYDAAVLESIAGLVERTRPCIRAEVYKLLNGAQRKRLFDFFQERDYAVHRFEGAAHYRGEKLSAPDMERWRHFDIFCVPEERA